MEKWYRAITDRYSVRNYKSGLSVPDMVDLAQFASNLNAKGVRIAVGRSSKIFSGKIFLHKITGTDCFAAVISKNGKDCYSGYLGEIFVLECVSRGFGTCWLGASYKQSAAEEAIELSDDEEIVCVIAIGVKDPGERKPHVKRFEIAKLTDLSMEDIEDLPEWQKRALFAARLAPSAMNRQPWEFYVYNDALGIVNVSSNMGYGMIDCGIAMIHAELGAKSCGVEVDWDMKTKNDEAILFPVKDEPDDGTDKASDDASEYETDAAETETDKPEDYADEGDSFDSPADEKESFDADPDDDRTFN